ncbi:MAG: alpha-1,2-fucosyltransferase [bacterium]
MIALTKLGQLGRLGNQLFQYAFLRTQAERLGVRFYCPKWIGDEIFELNDAGVKEETLGKISHTYLETFGKKYDREYIRLADETDIIGQFESEKDFDPEVAKKCFVFREDKVSRVKEKYKDIDFSKCVGIHLRLGDKLKERETRMTYFVPNLFYYLEAIKQAGPCDKVVIFSDDEVHVRQFFAGQDLPLYFVAGNADWEDLYLMTLCRDVVCGASTFSWWGGWLNKNPNKKVFFPKEGTFRPWGLYRNPDLIPDSWIKLRSLNLLTENYLVVTAPHWWRYTLIIYGRFLGKYGKKLKSSHPKIYFRLKKYFPDIKTK